MPHSFQHKNWFFDFLAMSVNFVGILLLHLLLLLQPLLLHGQQAYVNNKQNDCYNHFNSTDGNVCNGAQSKCTSYLTFRSTPPYTTPLSIAYLLGSTASLIASFNQISSPVAPIPVNTPVVVPVNCSCSGPYYQRNASYVLQATGETYFTVANNTYQGLTTCQALISQNPFGDRNLTKGLDLEVPLRCACPSRNQTAAGVNYLLAYLVSWGDSIDAIAAMFGADVQSIYDANMLTSTDLIYPFTPLLVPLKTEPTKIDLSTAAPPPAGSPPTIIVPPGDSSSSKKWVFVGVGIGAALLLLLLVAGVVVWLRRRSHKEKAQTLPSSGPKKMMDSTDYSALPENNSWSLSSEGLRVAVESLTLYKFEDLQMATGNFSEANRIQASVYKGSFKGDNAAVKVMKGDVSGEINILKQINHTNIIRLSGFCLHDGNTYLVYEFAENGSLADWLHSNKNQLTLPWKQRVQIAYDIADGLNYLHNYTNPPYVHKNLKTSNILLDANLRAKIGNFGLARSVENDEEGELQLTRHVVGTKGYMAPEYIENGVITPKLDVFALGVVILELMSGKEAAADDKNKEEVLWASIVGVLEGENVRDKLKGFMDPALKQEYPLDLAFSLAQLAKGCIATDLTSRLPVSEVFMTLSKILSSTLDWDPSDAFDNSRSFSGR